jgi:hypothetical protein
MAPSISCHVLPYIPTKDVRNLAIYLFFRQSGGVGGVGIESMEDAKRLSYLKTGSITHGSELSFMEFLDLFKSFR